jgi:hypothetical protein
MLKIPDKYSGKWRYVLLVIFSAVFISLMSVPAFMKTNIKLDNIVGFAALSAVVSSLIVLGGYLGARIFFYISFFSNMIALVYMIYTAAAKTADGWSDIAGIVSYLLISASGLIFGVVVQTTLYLVKRKQKN